MGCAGAALAAGWGLRFWAEVEIAAMSKTNRAILLKTFGIGEFFSLWSAPRLKKLGMEGKAGMNHKGHEGTQRDCQNFVAILRIFVAISFSFLR
jgi:hypothetical protein